MKRDLLILLIIGIFALMLVSCGNLVVEEEGGTGSGDTNEETQETSETRETEDAKDSEDAEEISAVNSLTESYQDALEVRDTVLEIIPTLEGELQAEMESVMVIFKDHIDALRYFVDENEQRELTSQETENLLSVLEDTAIMIELFGQVFDAL